MSHKEDLGKVVEGTLHHYRLLADMPSRIPEAVGMIVADIDRFLKSDEGIEYLLEVEANRIMKQQPMLRQIILKMDNFSGQIMAIERDASDMRKEVAVMGGYLRQFTEWVENNG